MKLNADSRTEIIVELDIFSGRPNPSWALQPPEREQLLALLAGSRAATGRIGAPAGLGYRGFVVRIASPRGEQVVHVGGETIETDGQYFHDADRLVENFFLRAIPDDLRAQFGSILPAVQP